MSSVGKVRCFVWRVEFSPPVYANFTVGKAHTLLLLTLRVCATGMNMLQAYLLAGVRFLDCMFVGCTRKHTHARAELQFWQLVHPTIVSLAEESLRTMGLLSSKK